MKNPLALVFRFIAVLYLGMVVGAMFARSGSSDALANDELFRGILLLGVALLVLKPTPTPVSRVAG